MVPRIVRQASAPEQITLSGFGVLPEIQALAGLKDAAPSTAVQRHAKLHMKVDGTVAATVTIAATWRDATNGMAGSQSLAVTPNSGSGGPFGGAFGALGADKTINSAAIQPEGARQMTMPPAADRSARDFQMFGQMFREHM